MENFELEEAIGWWALRKKRSYVRPAHYKSALHRNSFAVFWRYYSSPDEGDLKQFLRLSEREFEMIYSLVRRQLEAHCPKHLRPIEEKNVWQFLSGNIPFGPTYSAVAPLFVIGDSTVHDTCKEVSEEIVTAMQTDYLPTPTRQTWERSAEGFNRLRQFPKTLGAIDGKHIAIVKPEHSRAAFFNYKKFYSIVLLAIADAESRFLMVDSPEAALPPNEEGSLPFIFLGDGGFGCTDLVLTPFTGRGADSQEKIAFNCRLSRARSAVEHAFGIFAKRWRIFLGTIEARSETARLYTLAAVILHNFLRDPVEEEDLNLRFPDDRRMLIDKRAPEAGRQGRLFEIDLLML
uniref:DDE Tnp4 domain-containing protein n=1 Tax=Ditylenchus dipsaci TaxID=166011 RepID=A0A915DDZ9_9BILA